MSGLHFEQREDGQTVTATDDVLFSLPIMTPAQPHTHAACAATGFGQGLP